ncbi:FlgD immunoglobulin-like domain containing protein, partial [Candidatus Syntrophosphaera thermopropionivorans]
SQEKGHHRITWDGRDNDGNLSGNGIYYIVMKAGNQISQRKAVLMK